MLSSAKRFTTGKAGSFAAPYGSGRLPVIGSLDINLNALLRNLISARSTDRCEFSLTTLSLILHRNWKIRCPNRSN